MNRRVTAAALLLALPVLGGCGRTSTDTRDTATVDPSEAFPPRVIHEVDQTGKWDGLTIVVKTASAFGEYKLDDIDLSVDVEYANLGSEDASLPQDVRFEFGGRSYPAESTGTSIAAGATGQSTITGTLTDVVTAEPTSRDEMGAILSGTRLIIGKPGTAQSIFLLAQH